jgi:hypothetical protein
MKIERKGPFILIENSFIRISKIDMVKTRHIIKANNFGKVSDESLPEVIISVGTDKHVFNFNTEEEQIKAFDTVQQIITAVL